MILNTFTRKDGRNWYVQFSDPETGRRRVLVTPVRKGEVDAPLKLAKIRLAIQEKYARLQGGASRQEMEAAGAGWSFVVEWIGQRYHRKLASRIKHRNQWNYLAAFFHERDIHGPAAVERSHAVDYLAWRCAQIKEKSKRQVRRNTALADLRWAGTLLRECIDRNLVLRNPWDKLGFERDDVDVKPEFTDEQIARIREKLRTLPAWMRTSFEIALHTGLRFAETRMAFAHVDFEHRSILIAAPKGGKRRAYTIPMGHALRGLLQALDRKREGFTWTLPQPGVLTGLAWSQFFRDLSLGKGYCFHCTRVTFISRGARAGVPEHVMRRLVNHASAEVHRIYQRVTVQDVAPYADAVPIPAAAAASGGSRSRKSSRSAAADPAPSTPARRRRSSR